MEPATVIEKYFLDMLMPRNHGLIAITKLRESLYHMSIRSKANGLIVALANDDFLELNYEDGAIVLYVTYPPTLAVWDQIKNDWRANVGPIIPFSKNPKERAKQLYGLAARRVTGAGAKKITFDLFEPDSLMRAEFYIQTIISKIKYMVGKNRWGSRAPKDDLEFDDLIESASIEYRKKVIAPTRRKVLV